jgi:hypothetical protein
MFTKTTFALAIIGAASAALFAIRIASPQPQGVRHSRRVWSDLGTFASRRGGIRSRVSSNPSLQS